MTFNFLNFLGIYLLRYLDFFGLRKNLNINLLVFLLIYFFLVQGGL